jgi:hypothetical protein
MSQNCDPLPMLCRASPRIAHLPRVSCLLSIDFSRNAFSTTVTYSAYDLSRFTKACLCCLILALKPQSVTRLHAMAYPSRVEILNSRPIGDGLNNVRDSFSSLCTVQGIPVSLSALDWIGIEGTRTGLCERAFLTRSKMFKTYLLL